jgi:hypothetical protein
VGIECRDGTRSMRACDRSALDPEIYNARRSDELSDLERRRP